MTDSVNMSLDDIIKQNQNNRVSRTRGRGGGTVRGRGIRGGRGGRGGRGRGRLPPRSETPNNVRGRSRSRSRGPGGRNRSRARSQPRSRSRSRQRRYSTTGARSASRTRSQFRGLTPKGRAGLEDMQTEMPQLVRRNRGGGQTRFQRSNSNQRLRGNVHSRLGVNTRSSFNNAYKPLAVVKRGVLKRGRGLSTKNRFSNVGLRSDQILMDQHQNFIRNNVIRSQTFTRSRNNSVSSASQLTVSVANDFSKRRRNSVGSSGFLNKQSLASLNREFGGYNTRSGPGSVKSVGSNRSNRSNLSNRSNQSNTSRSNQYRGGRGRGRGRGGNRGIGGKFVNKQILNPKLQKEIAAIQGKNVNGSPASESPSGVNFTPTPAATNTTLHQRFAST